MLDSIAIHMESNGEAPTGPTTEESTTDLAETQWAMGQEPVRDPDRSSAQQIGDMISEGCPNTQEF